MPANLHATTSRKLFFLSLPLLTTLSLCTLCVLTIFLHFLVALLPFFHSFFFFLFFSCACSSCDSSTFACRIHLRFNLLFLPFCPYDFFPLPLCSSALFLVFAWRIDQARLHSLFLVVRCFSLLFRHAARCVTNNFSPSCSSGRRTPFSADGGSDLHLLADFTGTPGLSRQLFAFLFHSFIA